MLATFAALALFLTVFLQGAAGAEHSTALGAGSIFGDVIVTKMSYYRALASANPLEWSDDLATLATGQAINCGLDYDVSIELSSTLRLHANQVTVLGRTGPNHLQHW